MPLHRYTYADYVTLEQTSSTKHEFLDGEIYAMAGGSEEHSGLCAQVLRLLGNAIGERPGRVHTSVRDRLASRATRHRASSGS